jgi:uncharacterized membrane protein (DUF441 family)
MNILADCINIFTAVSILLTLPVLWPLVSEAAKTVQYIHSFLNVARKTGWADTLSVEIAQNIGLKELVSTCVKLKARKVKF